MPYKENPETIGDHLRKRRAELGIFQKEAAARLGVNAWTYLGWEHDWKKPMVRMLTRIIDFLCYDPIAQEAELAGALKAKRRALGLTQRAMPRFASMKGSSAGTKAASGSREDRASYSFRQNST